MRDNRDYPSILQRLFPGHPARRLLCTGIHCDDAGKVVKKDVTTRHRGAHLGDYKKHLDPKSHDGVGALGVIPTLPETNGEETRWFVQFMALDFDISELVDVMSLIAVLEEYRVYVYLDQGTTGRGVHLYIFLAEPLLQGEAHEVLVAIADLSKQLNLSYPEFMPSSASGPGKGIFLPYRGAAEDGFGANPLIDPIGGVQIPLDEIENEIYRTDVRDLKNFVESLGSTETASEADHNSGAHNPIDISTYAGAQIVWDDEIARLKSEWVEGRRQNLTLGATAYGISLGIGAERIKEDIEELERTSSDPEVKDRLIAVDRTVEKYAKGERIGWRKFYMLAGVEPPTGNKVVPWEVTLKLHALEDRLRGAPFKGMGGYTDLDVLQSLIEVGMKYGKLHPEGIEISISTRDLALISRVSRATIINSLRRLGESGMVMRWDRGRGTNSGSLVLLIDDPHVTSDEQTNEDGTTFHIPRVRWGAGKLGKTVRPILQNLQRLQPCTRADVARAMDRQSRDLRNPMNRLLEHRLVDFDEDTNTYALPTNLEDRLFEVLLADGTLHTDYKHKNRFKREREMFRALLSMKETQKERAEEARA